jgi:Family of unknown function (DUF6152)
MPVKRDVAIAVGLLPALFVTSAWAHHAFSAEFDANKPVKFEGATVLKMEWVNPHAWTIGSIQSALTLCRRASLRKIPYQRGSMRFSRVKFSFDVVPSMMFSKPRCPCKSVFVGMTDLPVRSTRAAPAGAATSPLFPTLVNLPPSMTKAPSSMAVPSPVITLAPSNSVASPCLV